jgi:peptidoglycan-associated lipoprotein
MNLDKTSLLLAATLSLVACSSTPVNTPAPAPRAAPAAPSNPAPAPAPGPRSSPAPVAATPSLPEYLDPRSPLSRERSVYFDFDDFSVKKEYQSLVEMHGRYLAAHPGVSIKVEGNADERGSAEYNLALGQKRAQAVVHALSIFGARGAQMEAISFGREKPRALGHDEASWAQNRRADLRYPAK